MRRFTRLAGQIGMRAALERVARHASAEVADRYDSAMTAARFRRVAHAGARTTRPTIVAMDSFVPRGDRDAGSRRLLAILELLCDLDYQVIFIPEAGGKQRVEARRLRAHGVDVHVHDGDATPVLESIAGPISAVWLSRPEIAAAFLPLVRQRLEAPVIYDTVDLHHVRLEREERVCGSPTDWRRMRDLELSLARTASLTVVTSSRERDVFADAGIETALLSIVEEPAPRLAPLRDRRGLLYVGNFTHAPNRDAVAVLVHEILPLVQERIPSAHLTIAGFDPTGYTRAFAGRGVRVLGYVADLESLLQRARVFVAPLRFGAGAKGKVVQSIAYGLPVVTTPIGAEGLGLRDGVDAIVREPGAEFAHEVVALLTDDRRWDAMSRAAHLSAERFSPAVARAALAAILARTRVVAPARA